MAITPSPAPVDTVRARAGRRWQLYAAGLAVAAGLVHALAGEGHFSEWWGYGVFFLAVSICQFIGGAALLFWSDKRLYWGGIIGTCVVLAIWTVSRTVGVPIGPDGAAPEKIGVLDGISVVLELATIYILAHLARHPETAPLDGILNGQDDA